MLVKSGADVHAEDNRHCSCLLAAVRRGHVDVVSWLCGDYRLSKPLDALSRVPPQLEKEGASASGKTNPSAASSSASGASGGGGGGGGGGGKKGRVARKPANGWSGVVRQFPNDAELERVRSQVPLEQSAAVPAPGAPKTAAAKAAVANSTAGGAANKGSATPAANAKKPVAQPGAAPQPVAPISVGGTPAGGQHVSRAPDGAKYNTPNPGKQTSVALQNSTQNANFNAKGLLFFNTPYNTRQMRLLLFLIGSFLRKLVQIT